jgi:murein DD-endopeptidase MepM/ murein hydrolase activator NlpD
MVPADTQTDEAMAAPAVPVAPIPAISAASPTVLVHLERLLPVITNAQVPATAKKSARVLPSTPITSRDLVPVFPLASGLEYESEVASTLGFEPADPSKLDLLWPVATRSISSAWGPRIRTKVVQVRSASKKKQVRVKFQGSHKGVDLTAPTGSDVYAALDGRVTTSAKHRQYGNYVIIDHGNGVQTVYAHNSKLLVQDGDLVHKGQKIAEVGRTGNATGPHLHFELRLQGSAQNPLPMMNDTEEIPAEQMALNETISDRRK